MHLDDSLAKIPPVLETECTQEQIAGEIQHNKDALDAWLAEGEQLTQLLELGVSLSGYKLAFAAVVSEAEVLVGAQKGTDLLSQSKNNLMLWVYLLCSTQKSGVFHYNEGTLSSFRENPLIVSHPEIISVYVFPFRNNNDEIIGSYTIASEKEDLLDENQLKHCKVVAKQLRLQLEFCRKVNELKESQSQLRQMNTELKRFASVAAHDLRSPLRAMGSFAGLLRRRLKSKLNAEELEYVDQIRSGATRLSAMVEGILSLAKATHEDFAKFQNIDLPTLVAEVADLIDPDQNHIIDFEGEHRRIRSSMPAIKQILMNLVSNAVKYHHLPSGRIIVTVTKLEDHYKLCVSDNGPGIAKEDQDRIFEAFETGGDAPRVPGTGLGLALVRSLVNRLGGKLSLVSNVGKGSTFEVEIPLVFKTY